MTDTAITQLIQSIEHDIKILEGIKSGFINSDNRTVASSIDAIINSYKAVINKATELLLKEREDMENAYIEGANDNNLRTPQLGSDYFDNNFNQYK